MADKIFKLCKRVRLSNEERNLLLSSKDLLNKSWKENIVHNYIRHGAPHGIPFYHQLVQHGHNILNVNSHGDNCFYTLIHRHFGYPSDLTLVLIDTAHSLNCLDELLMGNRFQEILDHPDGHMKILKKLHECNWLKIRVLPNVKQIKNYKWFKENFDLSGTIPRHVDVITRCLQNSAHLYNEDGSELVIQLMIDFPELIVPGVMKKIIKTGASWDNCNLLAVYKFLKTQGYLEEWADFFMTLVHRCTLSTVKELFIYLIKNKEINDFHWKYVIALNLTKDDVINENYEIKYTIWDIYEKDLINCQYLRLFNDEATVHYLLTTYTEENCKRVKEEISL